MVVLRIGMMLALGRRSDLPVVKYVAIVIATISIALPVCIIAVPAKKHVLEEELVGYILKYGLTDLCMECIQMLNNGE